MDKVSSTKVIDTTGKKMSPAELAQWANNVNEIPAFTKEDFYDGKDSRLSGEHCDCGKDENGMSRGIFVLLSLSSPAVIEGGKAYMQCSICGGYSHL